MYVIYYHNEHVFDNPGECGVHGPYPDLNAAKVGLAALVTSLDDSLFKIDPDPDASDKTGTYAGYYYKDLYDAKRDEDMAYEIWAEIILLTPPS